MSFSSEVKEELAEKTDNARHCRIAQVAALLHASGWVEDGTVGIRTENEYAAKSFEEYLEKMVSERVIREVSSGGPRGGFFRVYIKNKNEIRHLLEAVKMEGCFPDEENNHIQDQELTARLRTEDPDRFLLQKTCCRKAFLRGMFLASGSVSDPGKSYHFEIVCPFQEDAQYLVRLMRSLDLDAKIVVRKRKTDSGQSGLKYVVYLKEGEQISDVLGTMGAFQSLMSLENARILKNIAGQVNRQVNCEIANQFKTVDASVRQREDIRYLEDTIGLDTLPPSLEQTARLRLEMPDATLRELSQAADPPVGKSGINHRLQRLCVLAAKLREGGHI